MEGDDRICGRCYDEDVETFPANCAERPEGQGNLGMYHCPDCGAMLLGGLAHPWLCRPCLARAHPYFDAEGPVQPKGPGDDPGPF